MEVIESTLLWSFIEPLKAIGRKSRRDSDNLESRFSNRLKESFIQMRDRVSILLNQIDVCFRNLTVHDLSHTDALWQTADLLIDGTFTFNPAEIYVLGGAFLLHDAGLALASYPEHEETLRHNNLWRDCIATVFRNSYGRSIRDGDFSALPEHMRSEATEWFLRSNHAKNAEQLGTIAFADKSVVDQQFLIEDSNLRNTYGNLIGRIAYSHWWPVDVVATTFDRSFGAATDGPSSWTIDTLKLALILRISDALQIDSRRAPLIRRSLRKPTGISADHWTFQSRIAQPSRQNGGIMFNSTARFSLDDVGAWWIGSDLLGLADKELRDADRILRQKGQRCFLANHVVGCHDVKELVKQIPVSGWHPVQAQLHVSDVARLIERLGGRQLYGDNLQVVLRELLQNSRDAVVAKRLKYGLDNASGEITVSLKQINGRAILQVSDTGIGMSERTVSESLVDFGRSFWYSQSMLDEHPGLAAKGFDPTGEYGVGFFSVFMLGDNVKVITRRLEDGIDDTRVLEFANGVDGRLILREAHADEKLHESGTTVEVTLRRDPNEPGGLLYKSVIQTFNGEGFFGPYRKENGWSLSALCEWLAPALDVDLRVVERGQSKQVLKASDWVTMAPEQLLLRLLLFHDDWDAICKSGCLRKYADGLRTMRDSDGTVIGRATLIDRSFDCLLPQKRWGGEQSFNTPGFKLKFPPSVITAGPFRSTENPNLCGLVIGKAIRATRDQSRPIYSSDPLILANWASSQASVVATRSTDAFVLSHYAGVIRVVGGHTGELPLFRTMDKIMSFDELSAARNLPPYIQLIQDAWGCDGGFTPLSAGQIAVSSGKMRTFFYESAIEEDPHRRSQHPFWKRFWLSPWSAAVEAIAQAWNVPLDRVLESSFFTDPTHEPVSADSKSFTLTIDQICRPT